MTGNNPSDEEQDVPKNEKEEEEEEEEANDNDDSEDINVDDENNDHESLNSADEALMEMLGIGSLHITEDVEEEDDEEGHEEEEEQELNPTVQEGVQDIHCSNTTSTSSSSSSSSSHPLPDWWSSSSFRNNHHVTRHRRHRCPPTGFQWKTLCNQYEQQSYVVLPSHCSIPAEYMRRLTEELIWSQQPQPQQQPSHGATSTTTTTTTIDRTYETIQILKRAKGGKGEDEIQDHIYSRQVLTRLEQFVDSHEEWSDLCHRYIQDLVSKVVGIDMVLYKEKLNLKPAGGSGFAPHLDTPSLRIAFGENGPQTFCTVMVAIDDMTEINGCLKVYPGRWTEEHHISTILPKKDGNPDGDGRAGAIPPNSIADEESSFIPLICKGGTIIVFNGWIPHRSSINRSPFSRRAVFLTYNPKIEGDFHTKYYQTMNEKRRRWKESNITVITTNQTTNEEYSSMEMAALSTIPKI